MMGEPKKGSLRARIEGMGKFQPVIPPTAPQHSVVREYIRNQEGHHRKKTFGEEFENLLKENRIEPGLKPD